MYRYGPEIDSHTLSWLAAGAKFPTELAVRVNTSDIRRYEILDRNENGTIENLRKKRRGRKGFVLRVREPESKRIYAAKLCIPEDYASASPLTEIEFAQALREIHHLVLLPHLVGTVDRFSGEPRSNDAPWVCFISDWLEGITLDELVTESPDKVTPSLAARVTKDLITAVLYMEAVGLKHDDLTLGNLILEEPNPALASINPELGIARLRVIDLGSLKHLDRATAKSDDDWSLTTKCLATIYNTMHRNRLIASQYPNFMRLYREFICALADDHSRHFPDKGDYVRSIDQAESAITFYHSKKGFHPLEAISAEHLANDQILLKLFVDHLPWIAMVQDPVPCVLLGPRGCGKSMVFRYMATKTHITSKDSSARFLDDRRIFGVYVGCSSDLGNDLIWVGRKAADTEKYVAQIIDYFNLVVARELMRAFASAASARDFILRLGIQESTKRSVTEFTEALVGTSLRGAHITGMDPFLACADGLDRVRLKLGQEMRSGVAVGLNTGPAFIRELCAKIVSVMPAFERYRITFLLDDYTAHRLSDSVQSVLNQIVFYRGPTHAFKISSEPYGFDPTSYFGSRIDANREYKEIDAGVTCSEMQSSDRKRFVTELLDRRLNEAEYKGRVGTLIGDSEYRSDVKLAAAIRANRKGRQSHYNGIDVLSNAWSGDVATILHIVMNMFVDAGVHADSEVRIPNVVQHEAIVRVSKGLRNRISSYTPFGHEMSNILAAFGDLAATLLVEHKAKVRNDPDDINRKYRIEWTLPEGSDAESELRKIDASGGLFRLYKELIRRAVFHESLQSRGKEGPGRRTVRLQIRSSLLPSFGTSLQHKNHIKIDRVEDFAEFLNRTKRWADAVVARYTVSGDLFGELVEPEDVDAD